MGRRKTRRQREAQIDRRREEREAEKEAENKIRYRKWKEETKRIKFPGVRSRVPLSVASTLRAKVPLLFMRRLTAIHLKLGEWNKKAAEQGEQPQSIESAISQYVIECVENGDLSPLEGEPEKGDLIVVLK